MSHRSGLGVASGEFRGQGIVNSRAGAGSRRVVVLVRTSGAGGLPPKHGMWQETAKDQPPGRKGAQCACAAREGSGAVRLWEYALLRMLLFNESESCDSTGSSSSSELLSDRSVAVVVTAHVGPLSLTNCPE